MTTPRRDTESGGPLYREPAPAQRDYGLWVAGAGSLHKTSPSEVIHQRVLVGYAVVLVEQGQGYFTSRPSGRVNVRAGSALWLFPEIAHGYAPEPAWRERWLLFSGPLCEAIRAQGYLDPVRAVTEVGHDADALAAFDRAWRAYESGGPHAVALATAALVEFVVRSAIAEPPGTATGLRDGVAVRAAAILERRAVEGIGPAEIAHELGVPHSTLRRRFARATGFSLRDYAIAVRLRKAKALLVTSALPISEVAGECGFADPFYFTRLFTSRVGMSPSAFRRVGRL